MPDGGDKTYRALLDWMGSEKESERMCEQLMAIEGYTSLDPSHPLGGPDGTKDAVMNRNGQKWIMAVSFNRKPLTLGKLKQKFLGDCAGVEKNDAVGVAFCTNRKLTNTEKSKIEAAAPSGIAVDLFDIERIRHLLDQPRCYGIRLQFLGIEMTKEDQLAFIASLEAERDKRLLEAIREQNDFLKGLITGSDSCFECLAGCGYGNRMRIKTRNAGRNLIYDVQVDIEYTTRFEDLCDPLFEDIEAKRDLLPEVEFSRLYTEAFIWREQFREMTIVRHNIGNIPPGRGPEFDIGMPSDKNYYVVEVAAYARNGKFFTKFSFYRTNEGHWRYEIEKGNFLDFESPHPRKISPGDPLLCGSDLFPPRYPRKESN
jgi:hypothetical protein